MSSHRRLWDRRCAEFICGWCGAVFCEVCKVVARNAELNVRVCALQWFENERQRLINLRDRASEKGRKKEYPFLSESCVGARGLNWACCVGF
jgi:hypothetical protein